MTAATSSRTVPLETGAFGTSPATSTSTAGTRLANSPATASGANTITTAANTAIRRARAVRPMPRTTSSSSMSTKPSSIR